MIDLWVRVTDAGGSVGFAPPASRDQIAAAAETELAAVADGRDELLVVLDDDRLVGLGFLRSRGNPLFDHWRTVMRLMIDPDRQRRGDGRRLLTALEDRARGIGCDHLQLTVRDGSGLDRFYEGAGYVEVGRHPGAARVAGVDHDEIMFVRSL